MNIFDKFKTGLNKSSSKISESLKDIFQKKNINNDLIEEFRDLLIAADVGVKQSEKLATEFKKVKVDSKINDPSEIMNILSDKLSLDLLKFEKNVQDFGNNKSSIIVVSGVNGVGKTTTIGKIGKLFKSAGKSVVFGAADTFRAAAIDQLEIWAKKIKVDIIKSEIGSDPASVAFKTAQFIKKNEIDIGLIDTAGRLQNKKNLMDEYKKIINVLGKVDPEFPNEIILVVDATTGQNALNQVKEFSKIQKVTGLIVTKLDGTAKGGILISICQEYNLPILAIGMGEGEDDLQPFKADLYTKALLSIA